MQESELINKAENFYAQGDYKKALKEAQKCLKKNSKISAALVISGNVYFQNHKFEESLKYYLQAIESDSQNQSALTNTANVYYELKNYEQSYHFAKLALNIQSTQKTALSILGNSCLELEKYDEGKAAFLKILQMDSNDIWSYNSLSRIYQKTQDNERALAYGWKAVELSNGASDQHLNFGYLLYEINSDLTIKYTQQWLDKYGSNCIVQHMANALIHNDKITRAKIDYVQEIFDAFADDFEAVLAGLEYRAPQLIEQEIFRLYEAKKLAHLKILDMGCGTGLCGKIIAQKKSLKKLYGIDISEKMLAKAALKKCYKKLIQADIENYFENNKDVFDLIISADALTYFGELKKIISGCAKSLSKEGRLIITVSANLINDSDYYLHASGRFLHHQNYIKKELEKNGFFIEKISQEILRYEGENKVLGYVVTAQKKA